MDSDIEQGLRSLSELRTYLGQWLQSGPYDTTCERVGGVTAEASLAKGVTSLQIDHYWLQTTDLAEVASCALQAVNAAEEACKAQFWENLRGFGIGDFSWDELANADRRQKLLQDPTSFFQSFTSGLDEDANRRRPHQ